jgi:hypothetical protein
MDPTILLAMSQDIPRSLEELTPTWLTRVLRDDGVLGSSRVVERRCYHLPPGSRTSAGVASEC